MMTCEDILQKDWYNILGANPSESLQELKQKYQKLALLYHPDKQSPDVPAGELEKRVQRFIDVDQAWKILGNEETKKQYDLQRRAAELKQKWPVDGRVCIEDMDWDDDEQSYVHGCRCGGEYCLSKEDAEENVAVICCDTCSLSIEVIKRS
ncbi:dnaJ homolog subfamily C member 24-like [Acipenser ruthenus]|uniref:dnaJ homolog subfamily C member 24-like n=1 Tax=Acipenser ruthenus TaxID=7906 RepID=UPI00156166CD|nr:dnaJ homolog subfamily C member 24-like [Acipenser ruthenus]